MVVRFWTCGDVHLHQPHQWRDEFGLGQPERALKFYCAIRWAAPGLRGVILQPHWEMGALEAAERYAAIRHRHGLHLHCYAVLPGT